MTFSISVIAYFNKMKIVQEAEEKLNNKLANVLKDTQKVRFWIITIQGSLDFKEVFKWILSPKISRELNVPANLDGTFLINFIFAVRDEKSFDHRLNEKLILESIQNDLENLGYAHQQKRKQKQSYKEW